MIASYRFEGRPLDFTPPPATRGILCLRGAKELVVWSLSMLSLVADGKRGSFLSALTTFYVDFKMFWNGLTGWSIVLLLPMS